MTRPHRAVRVDENQVQIIADLQRVGAYVWRLSDLGGEVLDLLMCFRGKCLPVEVKACDHKDDLTDGEREGIRQLRAVGVEPIVATCAEDVIAAWDKPQWQVVDQDGVEQLHELMQRVLEMAVKLTHASYASPHRKKRICDLRDLIFKVHDILCASLERR